jgi:hypothetical protein
MSGADRVRPTTYLWKATESQAAHRRIAELAQRDVCAVTASCKPQLVQLFVVGTRDR